MLSGDVGMVSEEFMSYLWRCVLCKVLMHLRVLMRLGLYGKANVLYWKGFERQNSTHLTLLKHQNTKTALYKLPKNAWVIALFEIFGPLRKK